MGFFVVPASSEGFNNLGISERWRKRTDALDNTDVYRQINDNEFLYVNSFNTESVQFSFQRNLKREISHKITASRIKWNQRTVPTHV
jgi:lipopolysaccharide export system permease protein